MSVESENRSVPLGRIIRANFWLIALTTVIGLLLGIAASTRVEESAKATTSILLKPLQGNPFYPSTRGEQLVNLGTEAEALRSDAVAARVRDATDSERSTQSLLSALSVKNPSNTQILEVTFTAPTEAEATKFSQEFAEAYLDHRTAQAEAQIDGQVEEIETQITGLTEQLNSYAAQIAPLPNNSAQAEVIRQKAQTAATQLATLTSTKSDLEALPRDPGEVVTPAKPSTSALANLQVILIVIGGILGLGIGLAIAAARSLRDTRIHTVEDLDDLDVPVLGTFGTPGDASHVADSPIGVNSPLADEQIRKVRAAILARQHIEPWSVLVTASSARDHAPLVVAELAGAFARSGLETIVLHATLRTDEPCPLVQEHAPIGLCQLLLGRRTPGEAVIHVGPLLSAIPVGELAGEVSDLFVGAPMQRLVRDLKDRCDVLIISADPIRDGAAQSLTRVVDAVVLEVDQHTSTRTDVEDALRTLRMLSVPLDGAVLVGPEAEQWAREFRPHLTMPQRELLAGKGELPPGPPVDSMTVDTSEPDDSPTGDSTTGDSSKDDSSTGDSSKDDSPSTRKAAAKSAPDREPNDSEPTRSADPRKARHEQRATASSGTASSSTSKGSSRREPTGSTTARQAPARPAERSTRGTSGRADRST